ncbi:MAG: glycoside hydrolase family 127 protein, partial [Prolixibacteraceae bacterium]|nr:glycoside hydrolase family 127 protein [Prolixibacteraceae bacterium]
ILVNGQSVKTKIKPLSFAAIDRTWKTGDTVELVFDYEFHLKSMPDNQNVIALLFGPVLLAFETDKELILKGSQDEILHSLSKQPNEFSFILKNNGTEYKLVPYYQITKASYGVYATIRNEY